MAVSRLGISAGTPLGADAGVQLGAVGLTGRGAAANSKTKAGLSLLDLEPGVYYDITTDKVLFVGIAPQTEIVIYYEKELAIVEISAREDQEEGIALGDSQFVRDARKGEAIAVTAPQLSGYSLLGDSRKMLTPEKDQELVVFCYRKDTVQTGMLTVTVKNGTSVLAGATVKLTPVPSGYDDGQITGSDGKVSFNGVQDGTSYIVQASRSGYNTNMEIVTVSGLTTEHTISLSKSGSSGGNNGNNGGNNGGSNSGDGDRSKTQDPDPGVTGPEPEEPLVPGAVNELLALLRSGDHLAYIAGYPDGSVRPDASITRAEAAQMFYQLIEPYFGRSFTIAGQPTAPVSRSFRDVTTGQWYYTAVQTLSAYGILSGYPDGTFRPDEEITRAEFTVIVSQLGSLLTGDHGFADVVDHWAEDYIANASVRGYIAGYPDGTFRPEDFITRGEAISIANRLLARQIQKEDIPVSARKFTDLISSHWAYADIVEAANEHEYEWLESGYEIWRQ